VHGPRPTPRSAPYAAHATLTCHVKHAPFATRRRRAGAQVRADAAAERHLAAQLEAALRGVVCAERFPKSGVEVCVAVVEGEEDRWWGDEAAAARQGGGDAAPEAAPPGAGWGAMVVLAGCVTVAAAALVDAGVDCVGLVTGGVAALVDDGAVVLDPNPCEHERIRAACMVGYIEGRDEIAMLWQRGEVDVEQAGQLVEEAVAAAIGVREVVRDALLEDGDSEES
jgi:exosome complex component MTR3